MARTPTELSAPPRTYFDLLDEKYPELAQRPQAQPATRASPPAHGEAVRRPRRRATLRVAGLAGTGLVAALWIAGWPWMPNGPATRSLPSELGTAAMAQNTPLAAAPLDAPELAPVAVADEGLVHGVEQADRPIRGTVEVPTRQATRLPAPVEPLAVDRNLDESSPRVASAPLPSVVDSPPQNASSNTPQIASPDPPAQTALADIEPGRRLYAPAPGYSEAARQAGLRGLVRLEAQVNTQGDVTEVEVLGAAAPELEAAAIAALETWRFEPALRQGQPHAYRYRVAFEFRPPTSTNAAAEAPSDSTASTAALAPPDQPPQRLVSPMPAYPQDAWVRGVQGSVLLRAAIDEQGVVTGVEVLQGLPHGLTEAALDAVSRWRFRPAERAGRPVAAEHDLRLVFRL